MIILTHKPIVYTLSLNNYKVSLNYYRRHIQLNYEIDLDEICWLINCFIHITISNVLYYSWTLDHFYSRHPMTPSLDHSQSLFKTFDLLNTYYTQLKCIRPFHKPLNNIILYPTVILSSLSQHITTSLCMLKHHEYKQVVEYRTFLPK